MCDPMTLAGIALSTAGGVAQGQTQSNYVNAVNQANNNAYLISKQAREAELVRQNALEQRSGQQFTEALDGMGREQLDQASQEAQQSFTDTLNATARPDVGEQGFMLPGQGESTVAVKDWVAREANTAAQDARRRIEAVAKMSGNATAAGDRISTMQNAQNNVGVNNSIRRGSLGVSQFEQTIPAATVTPGSSILGDILSGAGMLIGSGAFKDGGGLGGLLNRGATGSRMTYAPPPRPAGLGIYG